jgi:histidyl-tRNA synthetase
MKINKPASIKGTRDFNALQIARRNWIFATIKQVYEQSGFTPLETPALEPLSTLLGNYGQEGEQLIFKILNSGDFLANVNLEVDKQDYKKLLPQIADKGLRYDLTVPLMRYVAAHKAALIVPFKRYQIQPVWRADRPQKGRYREFYQCDADIVGSQSLLCEAEILAIVYQILQKLGLANIVIQINHRDLLKAMVEVAGIPALENDFSVAIDKLDKIGESKVFEELVHKGFPIASLEALQFIFRLQGLNNEEKLRILAEKLGASAKGQQALQEIQQIIDYLQALGLGDMPITIEPTLARGLSYYTGPIFEIKLLSVDIGSIGGGGRYNNLTEKFGMPGLTGVGFSFGVDRLYAALEELNLFPTYTQTPCTQVLFTNLGKESQQIALSQLLACREQGIYVELYPEQHALKKQLSYANKKHILWVVMIGEEEQASKQFTLKNMLSGKQEKYMLAQLKQVLVQHSLSASSSSML